MIRYKLFTNQGTREKNEDSVGELDQNGRFCFALADGLGGHGKGEVASSIAVRSVLQLFHEEGEKEDFLRDSFYSAQNEVMKMQQRSYEFADMKTTLVTLLVSDGYVRWGHIGDSRLYYFSHGNVKLRTLDHSVPQMLVKLGEISDNDIRFHEDRNRLLKVIGSEWDEEDFDLGKRIPLKNGQAFLLCTDGFWEWIDETQMEFTLRQSESVEQWMNSMVEIVTTQGSGSQMDNFSAIAVWVTKE